MNNYKHFLKCVGIILLNLQPLSAVMAQQIAQTPTIEIKDTQTSGNRNRPPAPTNNGQPSTSQTSPSAPMVPNPTILIDGQPMPPTTTAPEQPFLPRAVAPPVGDMAVSNIDASLDAIDLGTTATVPRLVLREAPVREVLSLLARNAGLNIVFLDEAAEEGAQGQTVSLDLENQPVEEVFNSVLLISGLQANRKGNIIYIGERLPDGARNLVSRTVRLNQVDSNTAATFLASQGAEVQQLVIPITEVRDPETNRVVERREEAPQLQPVTSERPEGAIAPLILDGLKAAPDARLNSVTLVGEPRKVEIATSFLTQLDARRRQVAVNVKVIDVNLSNIDRFSSSFSFGFDDGFFVQDQGAGILNFGGVNPPTSTETTGSRFFPTIVPLDIPGAEIEPFFDIQNAPFNNINRGFTDYSPFPVPYSRPNFGRTNNPFQPGISDVTVDEDGFVEEYEFSIPGLFQYPERFLLTLQAQIESGNAKILTDPTLVVQEGQEATVQLTQQVLTSIRTEVDVESGVRTVVPVIDNAGLILRVNIERIDDNGFVNFSVSPIVSAPGQQQEFSSGIDEINTLTLLNVRSLASGLIRIRDRQTLIISGIIQETDRSTVSKVPILGDIPLLGTLFRSTTDTTERREVIILLTPQIVDENAGFGYNYRPGPDASEMLREQGFQIQGQP